MYSPNTIPNVGHHELSHKTEFAEHASVALLPNS
jgi:hypothetical protein